MNFPVLDQLSLFLFKIVWMIADKKIKREKNRNNAYPILRLQTLTALSNVTSLAETKADRLDNNETSTAD